MKAMMINSTQPDVYTAKMRDELYIRHLRSVQKINNRENLNLKSQLKQYHHLYDSHQKSRKQAKQYEVAKQHIEIERKNQQMNSKMKNIRSMYNFNLKKAGDKQDSVLIENGANFNKEGTANERYHKQNQETEQLNQISQQISSSIAYGSTRLLKNEIPKPNRLSLHYYLRKRQQQMIEHENQKLKKGILTQKSAYSSPSKKLNKTLKLPAVNSARHNFNERTMQIDKINLNKQTNSDQRNDKSNQGLQVKTLLKE